MSKDIVIIGAGGFGREIKWMIERINKNQAVQKKKEIWNLKGFVDDGYTIGTQISEKPIIGNLEWLLRQPEISVACAIGNTKTRKRVIELLHSNEKLMFPNLIDPSVKYSDSVIMGKGNLICADTILTVDVTLGDFNILNLDCTVGHDVELGSFVTLYPSVNLSGNVKVGDETEIGTGSQIIQGLGIGANVVVGAGAVIIREISDGCVVVGNPGRIVNI